MPEILNDKNRKLYDNFKEACESMEGDVRHGLTGAVLCEVKSFDILFHPRDKRLAIFKKGDNGNMKIHLRGVENIITSYPNLGMEIESENGSTINITHRDITAIIDGEL